MSQYPKYGNNRPYRKKNIGSIVQDAIKGVSYSRNLEELRNNIDITIREVSDLAKSGDPANIQPDIPVGAYEGPVKKGNEAHSWKGPSAPRFNPPSKGLYMFLLILGCFFTCIFSIAVVASLLISIFLHLPVLGVAAGICGVFLLLSLILTIFSGSRSGKINRFNRYMKYIGDAEFCSLEQLASASMEKPEKTKNNVQKMIAAGWFPNGHIDYEGTTLMLTEETYRLYLLAEDAKRQRQAEEARQKAEATPTGTGKPEVDEAIREGRAYIREIRRVNDAIPGEEISRKMSQLETITIRIFACVEKKPEKLPDIRRFMNYYLPTTLKLLNAYQEFDSQPIQSQKILSAKEEISRTLDTINQAFSSLMDTLYEDDILDISSDISVLETMFAQEGLTSSEDFHKGDPNSVSGK